MFTVDQKELTENVETGTSRFEAALVGAGSAPEIGEHLLVIEDGEGIAVKERYSFDILGSSGWRRYYAVRDTSIKGPAIIRQPVMNERSRGIFEADAKEKRSALNFHAICGSLCVIAGLVAYGVTSDAELLCAFIVMAAMFCFIAIPLYLPTGRTDLEGRLEKSHQPHEEVLSGRDLEITRRK